MTNPSNTNELSAIRQTLQEISGEVRQAIRTINVGVGFAFLMVVGLMLGALAAQGPLQQLEALTEWRTALTSTTCDSTLYTADELARRTPAAQRRLDRVCRTSPTR